MSSVSVAVILLSSFVTSSSSRLSICAQALLVALRGTMRNFYDVLGIDPNADGEEIKDGFQRLVSRVRSL